MRLVAARNKGTGASGGLYELEDLPALDMHMELRQLAALTRRKLHEIGTVETHPGPQRPHHRAARRRRDKPHVGDVRVRFHNVQRHG